MNDKTIPQTLLALAVGLLMVIGWAMIGGYR